MRAYRLLLHFYPKSFRAEYGAEMAADFAARRRRVSGPAAAALWLEVVADAATAGLGVHWDVLRQDVRTTMRTLGRRPGFAVAAVLVSGLGIGATTATFSIADHVLIRPLPFPNPEQLVSLWQDQSYRGYPRLELSPANYRDWIHMSTTLSSAGASRGFSVNLVGGGPPEHVDGAAVTADLLQTLGVRAAIGRLFTADEDRANADGTVILSTRMWHTHFGGDPTVLGHTIRLDDTPYTVIGVMPPDFTFPRREALFWVPMRFAPRDFQDRSNVFLHAVGRLKPGVTVDQARADFSRIAAELARVYPTDNQRTGATIVGLHDELSTGSRTALLALAAASACVLLIACSNLASLLLARALGRQRELAVRTALGAGRERIVRQMLTESAVLAAAGALVGVGLAIVAVPVLATLAPDSLPIAELPNVDGRLLALVTMLTAVTALGAGVGPALRAGRSGVAALRDGARAGTSGRTERLRATLVTIQVAASVALLIVSALLLRALWRVEGRDPGFQTTRVLAATTMLPMPKYEITATRWALYQRVLAAVRQQPGVESAAYISFLPMSTDLRGGIFPVTLDGHPQDPTTSHVAGVRFVTPDFFRTMGIPLREGRDITDADTPTAPWVAVVSESFASQNWPGESPLGRKFDLAFHERTVVGVVGNVAVRGLERRSEPQAYMPAQQILDRYMPWFAPKDLVIKSAIELTALAGNVRRIVHEADPDLPISNLQTLEALVDADNVPRQTQVRVLSGFAVVACLLAGLGIHGLLAFSVSARTREIGLRMAFGAHAGDILGLVLRQSAVMAGAGLLAGAGVAELAGQGLRALLAGVSPFDWIAFGSAASLAILTAAAGSLVPAVRAVRVDPLTAIRHE
jgi:predicted permease